MTKCLCWFQDCPPKDGGRREVKMDSSLPSTGLSWALFVGAKQAVGTEDWLLP